MNKDKGTLKSVSGNSLVLTLSDGSDSTRSVAPGAAVTLDGKSALLADLKAGDTVTLSGDPASSVSATR